MLHSIIAELYLRLLFALEYSAMPLEDVINLLLLSGVISRWEAARILSETSSMSSPGEKAVRAYTMETSLYRVTNTTLRNRDYASLRRNKGLREFILLLYGEIESKGTFHWGPLYRGIDADIDLSERHTNWQFMSFSANHSVAQGFAWRAKTTTMLELRYCVAVSVQKYSVFKSENEFLVLPGASLRWSEGPSVYQRSTILNVLLCWAPTWLRTPDLQRHYKLQDSYWVLNLILSLLRFLKVLPIVGHLLARLL